MTTATTPLAGTPEAAGEQTKTKDGKTSITITFGEKEAVVFKQIVHDADKADRTEAKYLAIWLRDNYGKMKQPTA